MAGLKIKRGDRVQVMTGKDRGTEGLVMQVLPREGKVVVEGVNTARRHRKARSATESGGILDVDMPIPAANVAVISPSDGKPTRVGYKLQDDGTKVRICRRTGAELG